MITHIALYTSATDHGGYGLGAPTAATMGLCGEQRTINCQQVTTTTHVS
jgi:hypothetical protein